MIREHHLVFDVHGSGTGRYRIWVDNQLMTERTWVWSPDYIIRERVPLRVKTGQHHLRVENLDPDNFSVSINNTKLDGDAIHLHEGTRFRTI